MNSDVGASEDNGEEEDDAFEDGVDISDDSSVHENSGRGELIEDDDYICTNPIASDTRHQRRHLEPNAARGRSPTCQTSNASSHDQSDMDERNDSDNDKGGDSEETAEGLVELMFGLSLALCTERPLRGKPSSMLLVYLSGILGFSRSSNHFLPARPFTP